MFHFFEQGWKEQVGGGSLFVEVTVKLDPEVMDGMSPELFGAGMGHSTVMKGLRSLPSTSCASVYPWGSACRHTW